jgi:hypothetical protein
VPSAKSLILRGLFRKRNVRLYGKAYSERMKKLSLALVLIASTAFAGEVVTRGAAISKDAKAVPLAQVLESPDAYTKEPVLVEGVIASACTRQGCWMQLAPSADDHKGVRVTFKDYGFFIPLDAKGMKARAEGVAVVKTLSKADADHLEEEGAKLKRNPDGTSYEVSFIANGVELTR